MRSADASVPRPAIRRGVSMRVILIGLVATPLNAYWICYTYWRFGYLIDRPSVIYFNCVVSLVGLVGLNALLHRWRSRWTLSAGELLTIYLMLSLATAWCGVDFLTDVPEAIANPWWFATPSNQWEVTVLPLLPDWLTVSDPAVIDGMFLGYSSFYRTNVIAAWAGPLLWWTAMVTALMLAFVCLSSIFRRRWSDEDKLPYRSKVMLRYGGLRLHRQGLVFFLGVIIGSAIAVFLRTLTAWIADVPL